MARPARPAGVHDLLAQPRRRAGSLRPRRIRRCCARGARSPSPTITRPRGGPPDRMSARAGSSAPASSGICGRGAPGRGREPEPARVPLDNAQAGTASAFTGARLRPRRSPSPPAAATSTVALAGCSPGCGPTTWCGTTSSTTTCWARLRQRSTSCIWNQDTVRLAAGLHRDFIELSLDNSLTHAGRDESTRRRCGPRQVDLDNYIVSRLTTTSCRGGTLSHDATYRGARRASCSPRVATSRR